MLVLLPALTAFVLPNPVAATPHDRDNDRLPDKWERKYRLSTKSDSRRGDSDRDRLRNSLEYRYRLNPRRRDTDRDGLHDGAEVRLRTDGRLRDTDGDGISDGAEVKRGTNPLVPDVDTTAQSPNPPEPPAPAPTVDPDPDRDGLLTVDEINVHGTDPLRGDSDGDGVGDGVEVADGSDPVDGRFFGAVRWVDGGSRGGVCSDAYAADQARSAGTPWCTLARAVTAAPAAATVRVRAGTYGENLSHITRTGWVRLQPAPGEHPVLAGIGLDDVNHIHLRGFEITGATRKVSIESGAHHIDIDSNNIHDVQTGFYLRGGGSQITLRNNTVRHLIWTTAGRKEGYGLSMVSGGWQDLTISHNHIAHTNGDALQLGGGTRVHVIGNLIEDIRTSDGNNDHADAIQISGSLVDNLIAANHIRRASKAIIVGSVVERERDGLVIENNLIHDITTNCITLQDTQRLVIRHNTCWDTGYGLWLIDEKNITPDTHTTGAHIYNNLLGPTTNYPTSFENRVASKPDWGTEHHNLLAQRTNNQTLHPTDITPSPAQLDALVQGVTSRNLRPRAGSILINAGISAPDLPLWDFDHGPRTLGSAPDIGAHEAF